MSITTLPPPARWAGDTAPVLIGVEHEYNWTPVWDRDYSDDPDYCDCGCMSDLDDEDWHDRIPLPDGWEAAGEHCGVEVRTDPTTDIPGMIRGFRDIERAIGHAGHEDCGLHVHLNANPRHGPAVNPDRFHKVWKRWAGTFIYPHVPGGVEHRHEDITWCRPVPGNDLVDSLDISDRYFEVNYMSLKHLGTVEIRLAGATDSIAEMEDWIRRCCTLASLARYWPGESPALMASECIGTGADYRNHALECYVAVCGEHQEFLSLRGVA